MKKLLYLTIAILSITLFGCENKIVTNTPVPIMDSISISDEFRGVEMDLDLRLEKTNIETTDILEYGIIYVIGEVDSIDQLVRDGSSMIAKSESLNIVLDNIERENYNRTFHFRPYFEYKNEDGENIIVYSDEMLEFNVYDLSKNSTTLFGTEVQFLVENEVIPEINIETNIEDYSVTSLFSTYDTRLYKYEDEYHLVVTPKTGYRFSSQVSLIISDELIEDSKYTLENQTMTFVFSGPVEIDPDLYVDVAVTFDPVDGFWPASVFSTFTPESIVSIQSLHDTSKMTVTLGDKSVTTLGWFYKLFIQYNETYDAYEVVYTDYATADISELSLPEYDYVIAVHDNCSDQVAVDVIEHYSKGLDEALYVVFDTDVSAYSAGTIVASFYSNDDMIDMYTVHLNEANPLPIPFKPEFTFIGWSDGESILNTFPRYQVKDDVNEITYTAIWDGEVIDEVVDYLDNLIPSDLIANVDLPNAYSSFSISWTSSNPSVLNELGVYDRPYQATTVTLEATIYSDLQSITKRYYIDAAGYKSLAAPLTSSYIYRDYSSVNDAFFTSLDIINCAFITADSNGVLSGASVLRNINNYIMPTARENGNWVLFSVAPSSDWSDIASDSNSVNAFADNIVSMINTYGFDGVDIDWETPTSSESELFTEMMRVIYTKVKANNSNHLVTAAIAGGMWQPPRYDLVHSHQYMDYINMMTYGMVSNNGYYQNALSKSTDFDNTANSAGRTLASCSIEESISIYNSYGIANNKIVVGVAFYGIKQTRTYDSTNQTWSNWANAGSVSYDRIVNNYLNNDDYNYYYDSNANVPYIVKTDGTEFISFDDSNSIAAKSEFIIDSGLAGMMYWENGLDLSGALLQAMEEGLK